jgi:hypothetical protein
MRKILIFLILVVLLFSGCVSKKQDVEQNITPLVTTPPQSSIVISSDINIIQPTPTPHINTSFKIFGIQLENFSIGIEYNNSDISNDVHLYCNNSYFYPEFNATKNNSHVIVFDTNCTPVSKVSVLFGKTNITTSIPRDGGHWKINLT